VSSALQPFKVVNPRIHGKETNKMDICKKDMHAKLMALINWFESQEISPMDAAYMCALMAGWSAAESLDYDHQRLRKGLKILIDTMQDSAERACQGCS
jgi:hypothetical protein